MRGKAAGFWVSCAGKRALSGAAGGGSGGSYIALGTNQSITADALATGNGLVTIVETTSFAVSGATDVPEPTSMALLASGAGLIGLIRRRKRG